MQKRTRAADVLPVPTESAEQQCLFRWAAYNRGRWPEMKMMYHIPNGGTRSKSEAGRFRAEGVKAGVPDICLPVARGGYHGMYIEMKRRKGQGIARTGRMDRRADSRGICRRRLPGMGRGGEGD